MFKYFDRYVLKEIFPPFLIGLLLFTFVLLMNQILLLAEMFIAKGVALGLAVKLLLYLLPSLAAFAVPMAVLMGILAGLSRLSTDSEIVAFKTLGISFQRLAWPLVIFAFGGWLATSYLALILAPRANYKWVQTITSSVLAKVQVKINPREFNETIPNMVLFIQEIDREKKWQNVFVYLTKNPQEPRLILAKEGRLILSPETKRATLELVEGTVHAYPLAEPKKYSVTSFKRLEEGIDVEGLFATLSSEKRVREKDIHELRQDAALLQKELAGASDLKAAAKIAKTASSKPKKSRPSEMSPLVRQEKLRDYRAHQIEIQKKFALPFVCFVFVLLGLPLGATTKKGGRTSGFTISIGVIFLYYVLITAGEKLAMDGRISPFLGLWGPNILLGAAGIFLFSQSLRERHFFPRLIAFFRALWRGPSSERKRRGISRPRRMNRRFPNILDRYISRKYLATFSLIFAGLILVSIVVTFFERIDNIYQHNKPLWLLFRYIWYRLPEFASFIFPVSVLTTTLLTLGLLNKFNEVTAMKACGISVYRIVFPFLFMALLVSLATFYLQERILPQTNIKAEETWNRINDVPPRSYSYINRHWMLSRNKDRIYHYDFFDPRSSAFSRLAVFDINLTSWSISRRFFSEKAFLSEDRLRLVNGWSRSFSGDLPDSFRVSSEMEVGGIEKKSYFLKEWKEPSQMTYVELKKYVSEVSAMGFETTRFAVDLAFKISFPVVALIMTLLAIPFAFSMGKRGALVGIGLSIIIAMVYWGAIAVFRSLGYVAFLPPFFSAWGPNLIFGLMGTYLLFRLRT